MSKRLISVILALLCLVIPMNVSAYDINESPKLTYTNSDTTLPYRLILPEDYSASKQYPLIVFFHGAGERGNDNELQFVHCVQYIRDNTPEPCIIVAPQCPTGNQWVDTPWSLGAYSTDNVPESNEMKAVIELLLKLQDEYSVDSDRIYAMGISMGGFATWDAITRHSDMFAAAIPVCGGGDPSKADILKDIPIYTFHAINDPDVPVSGTQQTVSAIKAAGGTKIFYTEYSYGAHGIWNMAFATEGLFTKLFAAKLSDRTATQTKTNVALNKSYDATPLDDVYTANLTDGVMSYSLSFDGNWFIFKNNPGAPQPLGGGNAPNRVGTVVIDLDGYYDIDSVSLNLVHQDQSGVNIPSRVTVYLSNDGEVWDNGTSLPIPDVAAVPENIAFSLAGEVLASGRFVKVEIALGAKSFVMLNEIEVFGVKGTEPKPNPDPDPDPDVDPDKPEIILGDVNNDQLVNQYDYILVKRHYFGTRTLSDAELDAADVNLDSKVDQYDYILICRHYFGTYKIA